MGNLPYLINKICGILIISVVNLNCGSFLNTPYFSCALCMWDMGFIYYTCRSRQLILSKVNV